MPKKTTHPLPDSKKEIKGRATLTLPALEIKTHGICEEPFRNSAGEIYIPPPAGLNTATPQPTEEENAEFDVAWPEALALSEQRTAN
jgi:hypothetical protein